MGLKKAARSAIQNHGLRSARLFGSPQEDKVHLLLKFIHLVFPVDGSLPEERTNLLTMPSLLNGRMKDEDAVEEYVC